MPSPPQSRPDRTGEPPGRFDRLRTGRALPPHLVRATLILTGVVLAGLLGRGLLSDAGQTPPGTEFVAARDVSGAAAAGSGAASVDSLLDGAAPTTVGTPEPGSAVPEDAPGAAGAPVVVHVVGKVRRPGLVTLTGAARVADAVTSAGGATRAAALGRINLARPVVDGEQIVVPGPDDPLPAQGGGTGDGGGQGAGAAGADTSAVVNLNTATAVELESLPGVGPVTAGRILDWRRDHQRFTSVDELGEVTGIGPKTLARLRPLVTV